MHRIELTRLRYNHERPSEPLRYTHTLYLGAAAVLEVVPIPAVMEDYRQGYRSRVRTSAEWIDVCETPHAIDRQLPA